MKSNHLKSAIAVFAVAVLLSSAVFAETKKEVVVPLAPAPTASAQVVTSDPTVKVPDTSNIMFMQNMRKIGATIYYLGEELGLNGWFVVKDGQVQILYTTPDGRAVLIGALLSAEGANISQQQVMVLANNNPEIQKIVKGSAAVTGKPPEPATAPSAPMVEHKPAPQASVSQGTSPQAMSPSEKFFDALLHSANLTFGKETAPQLLMIMDVNCPHCHRAWKAMQPLVDLEKLRVTMIPVAALGQESAVQGANWLASQDPNSAWRKHVAGDEKIFAGATPPTEKVDAVRANTTLIQKWGVDQTPYILYRGKNGKIRLIVGEPKNVDEIMSDIM